MLTQVALEALAAQRQREIRAAYHRRGRPLRTTAAHALTALAAVATALARAMDENALGEQQA